MHRITTRAAHREIAECRPFRTHGSLAGRRDVDSIGRLDPSDPLAVVIHEGRAAYVVTSYSTPIAALTTDGRWVFTPERFSFTTSRHQGLARYGASLSGFDVVELGFLGALNRSVPTGHQK